MDILIGFWEVLNYTTEGVEVAAFPILAALQLAAGIAAVVANEQKRKEAEAEAKKVSDATNAAVREAAQMKNITQGAGTAQAQSQARQVQADTINLVKQSTNDPNKIALAASQSNIKGLKAAQQRDAATEQQRLFGQRSYVAALRQLGMEQKQGAMTGLAIQQGRDANASNLVGAGIEGFSNNSRDNYMMNSYSKIQRGEEVNLNSWGKGTGWMQKIQQMFGSGSGFGGEGGDLAWDDSFDMSFEGY